MAVTEKQTLDMSALLLGAYELAEMIIHSADTADYLYWKERQESDPEVKVLVREFGRKKELFEETQRFGHFHPNYHEALDRVKEVQEKLERLEPVHRFKSAEERLDEILFEVSETLARAVSDSIKVPGNGAEEGGGCSSGGSCSGKCG
ncbi:YlbF family regulator [Paenibacillus filicis]|uniref:YlbF family regulator n=1 Tax=Paenibacillus gyeongsangnamensis TaxID=3388067 RepID=A0ABT4Q3G4_9BACL|nr:YlbF family regulator [Paenibacillus filicis]MCZ8511404.1 YlbF family regulator [Paenibacillus filicis]